MKKQYQFSNSKIELFVKPSPKIVRLFLLIMTFILIGLPILSFCLIATSQTPFHIGFLIGWGVFSLLSFYFYKLFLWNTYGKEVIEIKENNLIYYADYKKFIRNQQEKTFKNLTFAINQVGYDSEQLGVLIFLNNNELLLETATIIPIKELKKLIEEFEIKELIDFDKPNRFLKPVRF